MNINLESAKKMQDMANMFNQLNEEQQKEILKLFNEEDKITFLKCMGICKLMTDRKFYHDAQQYIAERLYEEFNAQ